MERKLASIVKINSLSPIPGADAIEVAQVKGWKVVVKKGDFAPGDLAIYYEIDSFLPIRPEFEFLRKNCHKKLGDKEGFRLKTIKLRGQISQGLLTPIDYLVGRTFSILEGDDVTEILGVVKYEPPIPAQLQGIAKGNFPSFFPKTDEERIQNLSETDIAEIAGSLAYITEKLEGSSLSVYFNDGKIGVCSRNLELEEDPNNSYWKAVIKYGIPDKLTGLGRNIVLQGELVGPGIQGNIYGLTDIDVYFFNAYDIDNGKRLAPGNFLNLTKALGLKNVPVLEYTFPLPTVNFVEKLLQAADGDSRLAPTPREGIVIRGWDKQFSFKVISNNYLCKARD